MEIFLPFGRHRGVAIRLVPTDYLQLLTQLPDLELWLRHAVEAELERRTAQQRARHRPQPPPSRGSCPDPELACELVSVGLRHLARRHHPDVGGDHDTMVKLNNCADWLLARSRSGR